MKDTTRFTPNGKLTRAYRRWDSMIQRCTNPKHAAYKYYGGRGITVATLWLDFDNFFADMGHPPKGKWIERKDNSKGYEPGNCCWVTPKQQMKNRRSPAPNPDSIRQRAIRAGLEYAVVYQRLNSGWSERAAFSTPKLARGERNVNCYA